jgi:hypothetical protein
VIESLHPFAIGVAVACMPVATILVSAGIDYFSHRSQEQQTTIAPPIERGRLTQPPGQPRNARALPASTRRQTNVLTPDS